jgi:hypothetical protein
VEALSFLPSLIWATILAVALWPLYLKFATRFMAGPSASAAFVFTLLVALVLMTPISLAVYTVAQQSDMLIDWRKRAREGGIEVPDWVARLNLISAGIPKVRYAFGTRRRNHQNSDRGFCPGSIMRNTTGDHSCVPPGVFGKPYFIGKRGVSGAWKAPWRRDSNPRFSIIPLRRRLKAAEQALACLLQRFRV